MTPPPPTLLSGATGPGGAPHRLDPDRAKAMRRSATLMLVLMGAIFAASHWAIEAYPGWATGQTRKIPPTGASASEVMLTSGLIRRL